MSATDPSDKKPSLRPVRSFVLRGGRLTPSQSRALETLYPDFGVEVSDAPLDIAVLFGRSAPLWVEVGFGNGESLVSLAARRPEINFIGIEVHRPGVGHCLKRMQDKGITNLRVLEQDAVVALRDRLPVASLARLLVLFPDPWHKKRHHKRRLITAEFAAVVAGALKDRGVWHIATDWEPYAEWIHHELALCPQFRNTAGRGCEAEPPEYRVLTRFEARGVRLGHRVQDLVFERLQRET